MLTSFSPRLQSAVKGKRIGQKEVLKGIILHMFQVYTALSISRTHIPFQAHEKAADGV